MPLFCDIAEPRKIVMKIPTKLYKYREFNVNSLQLLCDGQCYYADPLSFNDPLDCKPELDNDLRPKDVEVLYLRLLEKNQVNEQKARNALQHIRYMSEEYNDDGGTLSKVDFYVKLLVSEIQRLLSDELSKQGVLSLGKKWNCPLMWSHYADEHRGICIEFSTVNSRFRKLGPVRYNCPRIIKLSDVAAWKLRDCEQAKESIHQTVFYSKAPSWRYEAEWRDISESKGPQPAPAWITSVLFGMRCDYTVRVSIVKLLSGTKVQFYDIHTDSGGFSLARRRLEPSEIEASAVRSSSLLEFGDAMH